MIGKPTTRSRASLHIACSCLLAVLYLAAGAKEGTGAKEGAQKQIVGATETIYVEEADLTFEARVDTGATSCSIHAVDIEVETEVETALETGDDPVGKPVTFRVVAKDGTSRTVRSRVASVVTVRTSEGSERRLKVPLTLVWNDSRKTVLVTLNDRSHMTYRLLLGRNWLRGDFLVDVDKDREDDEGSN